MKRAIVLLLLATSCIGDAEAFRDRNWRKMGRAAPPTSNGVQPVEYPDIAGRYAMICSGQSRGCGTSGSASAVTTTQPYDNSRATGITFPFVDLVETTNETILSSFVNQLTSQVAAQTDLIGFARFADGTRWDEIDQGSTTYNNLIAQAQDMVDADPTACIPAIVMSIGETDGAAGTTGAAYMATGLAYRVALEADLRAINALCSQGLVMFLEQTPAWTGYQTAPTIPLAQLDMHNLHNHRTFLLPVQNYGAFTDGAHNTAQGKQDVGTRFGTPLASIFLPDAYEWEPLQPRRTVADGNFVRMYYITPCKRYPSGSRCAVDPAIVLDTTTVSNRTNQYFTGTNATGDAFSVWNSEGLYSGLRYEDPNTIGIRPRVVTGPTPVANASCSECASDETRVDIELSSPARDGSYIGVSDISQSGTSVGCDSSHGLGAGCEASSNIRDSDNTSPWTGSATAYRFAAISRQLISGAATATQLSQVANTVALSVGAGSNYWDVPSATITGADVNNLTTKFSFFMLRNFSTQTTNNIILSKGLGAAGAFFLKQTNTNDLAWQFSTTSNSTSCSGCDLSTSVTYCLAGSYDGARPTGVDRARLYVGRPSVSWTKPTQNQTGTIPASMIVDTNPLRVGYVNTNPGHVGDEEMLWFNAALTSSQLRAICNSYTSSGALIGDAENTTDLPVPSAWYRHDGDTGTTVTDAIAGTFNGTTHGTVTQVGALAP